MFNIELPVNFNSPYKSSNIQDFWRRWHITLSNFLRDYIYIPLGGNRNGEFKTYANLMITFLLGGIWHGAGWTFVFWGFLHGIAMILHRIWQKTGIKMNKIIAWFITFNFINITWVIFRANKWEDIINILKGMFGLNGIIIHSRLYSCLGFLSKYGISFGPWPTLHTKFFILWLLCAFIITVFIRNSIQLRGRFELTNTYIFVTITILLISFMKMGKVSEFLYFQF